MDRNQMITALAARVQRLTQDQLRQLAIFLDQLPDRPENQTPEPAPDPADREGVK